MTEIEVFSTPQCPYCDKVKQWLDDNGYSYQEYNVQENQEKAREMIQRTQQRGVPQVFIGEHEIVGFRTEKIQEAIDEEGIEPSQDAEA